MKRRRLFKGRIASILTRQAALQRAAMRNFIGALNERGAGKSVFITASRFSASAKDTAEKAPQNVIAIDGE